MIHVKNIFICGFLIVTTSIHVHGMKHLKKTKKTEIFVETTEYHTLGMMLISGVTLNNIDQMNEALRLGANINYQTQDEGNTAFHIACVQTSHLIQALVTAGINVNIKNKNGHTAIEEMNIQVNELIDKTF